MNAEKKHVNLYTQQVKQSETREVRSRLSTRNPVSVTLALLLLGSYAYNVVYTL